MDYDLSRREFLRRAGALGIAGVAAPLALNLSILGEAVAATAPSDYKALVCVYMAGGNDCHNVLIPADAGNYAKYAAIRQSLAVSQSSLSATLLGSPDANGRQMALAPQWVGLKPYFDAGTLGVISNIGPLVVPTSKDDYKFNRVPLPPKLMSHNDQTNVWLSGAAEGAGRGWGGRIADLYMGSNTNSALTCIMAGGSRVFLSGKQTSAFAVGTGSNPTQLLGGSQWNFGSNTFRNDLMALMTQKQNHEMANVYADICNRGISTSDTLANVYKGIPEATGFPTDTLGNQLKAVARMIAARSALGNQRQVFMVQIGGFDLHDDLVQKHPVLLKSINDALLAFQNALTAMSVQNNVTTFTASEFGRTLSSNGDGSDHGWGGHHLVMGGAVKGGKIWGPLLEPVVDGPVDIGQGRIIPHFATDQLAWELAKWFGASDSDRDLILPTMSNFNASDLSLFA
ncbi:DUF1501 domain-containing protein [Chitinibacter bivalviorum]|uniref:DUF1501 domain-containing protein n=1 Tax=Chitinibacter bivalviorum TaxID=2739434 RepID=A0A7H9BMG3_9NEIS|nr:DUF1501 domain-containing protein [Chitinibacter bivalviorum]QLG88564.1 DUF1501 domain-containing protein [Chitinibacter bivalviorum]